MNFPDGLLESPGSDAVVTLLVFLELPKGDAKTIRKGGLAQPQDNSTLADALPDVLVDLEILGPAGLGPSRSSRHIVPSRSHRRRSLVHFCGSSPDLFRS